MAGLRAAAGEGRDGRIQDVHSCLAGMEVAHLGHAAGAVGMKIHRQVDLLFDRSDQVVGILGRDQSGHVLDADGVASQLREAGRQSRANCSLVCTGLMV